MIRDEERYFNSFSEIFHFLSVQFIFLFRFWILYASKTHFDAVLTRASLHICRRRLIYSSIHTEVVYLYFQIK